MTTTPDEKDARHQAFLARVDAQEARELAEHGARMEDLADVKRHRAAIEQQQSAHQAEWRTMEAARQQLVVREVEAIERISDAVWEMVSRGTP